jgi:hypothetical protein
MPNIGIPLNQGGGSLQSQFSLKHCFPQLPLARIYTMISGFVNLHRLTDVALSSRTRSTSEFDSDSESPGSPQTPTQVIGSGGPDSDSNLGGEDISAALPVASGNRTQPATPIKSAQLDPYYWLESPANSPMSSLRGPTRLQRQHSKLFIREPASRPHLCLSDPASRLTGDQVGGVENGSLIPLFSSIQSVESRQYCSFSISTYVPDRSGLLFLPTAD